MSRALLQKVGAFVASAPSEKTFDWTQDDGETVKLSIFVRHIAFGEADAMREEEDKDPDRSRSASWLSKVVCFDPEGKEGLSYEDAYQLKPDFAKAL